MKTAEAGVYWSTPVQRFRATTRLRDTDVGTDVGYCAVDARRKSNEWQSAERETACWGQRQRRLPGHTSSLTEWWHRSWSCMHTAAADAVGGHRGAEEEEGVKMSSSYW